MFYFSYYWLLRNLKLSEIVMLLFLMMTTLSMMPGNVWGEEIYTYTAKEGTMVITNIHPQENINFNTWNSNTYQDSTAIYKDGTIVITNITPQENNNSNTKNSNSFQDSTREERLHWGRDNALIDAKKKGKNGQRKTVKDGGGIDAGVYKVKIKKVGSNLYQDIYTHSIIKTRACVELAGGDEALLDWSDVSGELFFRNMKKSCIVKKVYK
jgi:hypothetical protein